MENEKRKAPRIEKVLVAKYSPSSQEADCWDSTMLKNISTEGILLYTKKAFACGEILKLLIKIPSDPFHWMEAKGKVVESLANITRIEFAGLNEEQRKLIRDYVEWFIKNNLTKKQ